MHVRQKEHKLIVHTTYSTFIIFRLIVNVILKVIYFRIFYDHDIHGILYLISLIDHYWCFKIDEIFMQKVIFFEFISLI